MKGLSIGSCFVEHIGSWLQKTKFNLQLNPFGIAYNPISISRQIALLSEATSYPQDQLFQHQDLWHSFDHHSAFSGVDLEEVTSKINNAFAESRAQLKKADYLLITFGTANVYTHKKTNRIVSNCHKIPNTEFHKRRLTVKEIMTAWETFLKELITTAPNLKVIFTVSPVRHLKDGFIENQRSKAVLLLAIDNLVTQYENCHYFPSYEIIMDDLRDYRFYTKDMLHPNAVAIDYIKEKFANSFFSSECKSIVAKIKDIQKAVEHKAFQPDAVAHQHFLKKTLEKIEVLEGETGLDFSAERLKISSRQSS